MTRRLRRPAGAAILGAVLLAGVALLLAPSAEAAIDLSPGFDTPFDVDVPGPNDLVEAVFQFVFKTFFGIEAKVTRRAVEFLVAHPVYTDTSQYPEVNQLRSYVTAGSWGIFSLVVTISALRYWASGLTASGSYEAIEGLARGGVAAGALAVYAQVFGWLCVAVNLLTHALLHAPGVHDGIAKLLAAALVANFAPLGLGAIASVAAVVMLVLLVITKIVIATVLGLLFVSGALGIALWPLPETSWVARTWLQALLGVLLWPVVWALCFAFFAVSGKASFSFKGSFGTELIKPWVTVAALYVAFQAPRMFARQALAAGLAPNVGRGMARTLTYGRVATRTASAPMPAGGSGRQAQHVAGAGAKVAGG